MRTYIIAVMTLVILSLALGAFAPSVQACPGCKEALATQSEDDPNYDSLGWNPAYAYSYSVLFMLAVPAGILITFGTAAWRLTRKPTAPPEKLDWDVDQRI
jgi:hypothetical protein